MNGGWMLDVTTLTVVLAVWVGAVLVHGAWRSRSDAAQDAIRPSGPIVRN